MTTENDNREAAWLDHIGRFGTAASEEMMAHLKRYFLAGYDAALSSRPSPATDEELSDYVPPRIDLTWGSPGDIEQISDGGGEYASRFTLNDAGLAKVSKALGVERYLFEEFCRHENVPEMGDRLHIAGEPSDLICLASPMPARALPSRPSSTPNPATDEYADQARHLLGMAPDEPNDATGQWTREAFEELAKPPATDDHAALVAEVKTASDALAPDGAIQDDMGTLGRKQIGIHANLSAAMRLRNSSLALVAALEGQRKK